MRLYDSVSLLLLFIYIKTVYFVILTSNFVVVHTLKLSLSIVIIEIFIHKFIFMYLENERERERHGIKVFLRARI